MKDGKFEAALLAFDDARRFFGGNISDEWTARIIINTAHVLCSQGDFDDALAMYDEIIQLFDKNKSMQKWILAALYYKGSALDKQDKLDAAITAYDKVLSLFAREDFFINYNEIRPGDIFVDVDVDMVLIRKAAILVQQGKLDAATLIYEEINRLGNYHEQFALLLSIGGGILEEKGALDAALVMYEEVDLRFGDSDQHEYVTEALSRRAAILRQQGKLDAATALSEEIERRFGQDAACAAPT
jgi:tetratricopeptide (TPR) repeat protein